MTSQRVERTWIRTGGYGRFRGEWVKVVYSYYSSEIVTPIFLSENLLELSHDAFKNRILK